MCLVHTISVGVKKRTGWNVTGSENSKMRYLKNGGKISVVKLLGKIYLLVVILSESA